MMPKPRRSDVLGLFEFIQAMFCRSNTSKYQQSTKRPRFASPTSLHIAKMPISSMPKSELVSNFPADPNMPKRDDDDIGCVSALAACDFLSFYDLMNGVCFTSARIWTTTMPFRSRLLQLSIVSIDTLK